MELISNAVLYFHKGGFVMYLLLICSLFVVSIAIERSMFFSKMDAGRKFAQSFYDFMTHQKYAEAAEAAFEAVKDAGYAADSEQYRDAEETLNVAKALKKVLYRHIWRYSQVLLCHSSDAVFTT